MTTERERALIAMALEQHAGIYAFPHHMSRVEQLDYISRGAAVIEANLREAMPHETVEDMGHALCHFESIFAGAATVPMVIETITRLLESAHSLREFCDARARDLDRIKGGKRFRAQVVYAHIQLTAVTLAAYRQCAARLRTQS